MRKKYYVFWNSDSSQRFSEKEYLNSSFSKVLQPQRTFQVKAPLKILFGESSGRVNCYKYSKRPNQVSAVHSFQNFWNRHHHKYNILAHKCFLKKNVAESIYHKIWGILSAFFNRTKNCTTYAFVEMLWKWLLWRICAFLRKTSS